MHALCNAQYVGSHLCHWSEYNLATPATPVPADGAWLDSAGFRGYSSSSTYATTEIASVDHGRFTDFNYGYNCGNWTANDYLSSGYTYDTKGTAVIPAGESYPLCKVPRVLACCTSPYKEEFAGFTPASVVGAMGGREMMHGLCATTFSGSHMCHMAEYERATSPVTPPAAGAWLDTSAFQTSSTIYAVDDVASRAAGRFTDFNYGYNCGNWTANDYVSSGYTYDTKGTAIAPEGAVYPTCKVARPVACCF
jgi:hypothetical protein